MIFWLINSVKIEERKLCEALLKMNRVEKLRDEEGKVKYFKIKKEEYEKGKEKNTNKENSW